MPLSLGEACLNGGLQAEARTAFAEAAEIARALGSAEQLGRAALGFKAVIP